MDQNQNHTQKETNLKRFIPKFKHSRDTRALIIAVSKWHNQKNKSSEPLCNSNTCNSLIDNDIKRGVITLI